MCAGDAMKDLAIRWLIKRDMPEVLEIAHSGYSPLLSEDDFLEQLRKSNCIGVVAELNHDVLGFMVYCLEKSRLVVINFAVHPAHRRKKIGTAMVECLVDKLSQQRRTEIEVSLPDSCAAAQMLFSSCKFRQVAIVRSGNTEPEYLMEYRLPYVPVNRMTQWFREHPEDHP